MEMIKTIGEKLIENKATISTAESCTAGYISKILTSVPGSSNYFEGSIIAYSNKVKVNVLGVEQELVDTYTEVSDQVARRMAERVKEVMGTEYSIATTGYADPDGYGTEENPAGTIYVAVSTPYETICTRLDLDESRSRNVYHASIEAIQMIGDSIKTHQVV